MDDFKQWMHQIYTGLEELEVHDILKVTKNGRIKEFVRIK